MRLQSQRPTPGFEENLTRQLTSLRQSVRDDAAKTLDQLSPEGSLRILSGAIEKAYLSAQRRRPFWIVFCMAHAAIMLFFAFSTKHSLNAIMYVGNIPFWLWMWRRGLMGRISDPQLQLVWRFNEQVKRATLPSAVGPILDVLRWPMNYSADQAILKVELKRLLALADDDTVGSLTPMQLETLAKLIRPLDNPEFAIAGLLTLASARYADAELLKKTASLALTDAPLGLAAREYRRAVGETR